MIRIQQDVWRSECIAAIGWDEDCEVQVFPVNCAEYTVYLWDTHEEAAAARLLILNDWKRDLGA